MTASANPVELGSGVAPDCRIKVRISKSSAMNPVLPAVLFPRVRSHTLTFDI
jgi:hypothetical protein